MPNWNNVGAPYPTGVVPRGDTGDADGTVNWRARCDTNDSPEYFGWCNFMMRVR